jgi:hypothetical protein
MVILLKSICYKKVRLSEDEFSEYQAICSRYPAKESLFQDRFETDEDGRIIFIKSMGDKEFSFEAMHFLQNLMINQWLRYYGEVISNKLLEFDKKIKELSSK